MPLCVVSGATTTTRPKPRATSTAAASPFESYPSSLVTSISLSSFIVSNLSQRQHKPFSNAYPHKIFPAFDLPVRRLSHRKDSERRATKRKFVSDFVRGAPCCPRRPVCPCHPVASVAPLPVVHAAPCLPKPALLLLKPARLCPSRPRCVQAALRFTKAVSRSAPPVPPEPPPFSVKTTINRAPKRYFYTPFAPNEKKLRIFALPFRAYINLFHWVPRGCARRRGRLRRSEAADAGLRIRVSVW